MPRSSMQSQCTAIKIHLNCALRSEARCGMGPLPRTFDAGQVGLRAEYATLGFRKGGLRAHPFMRECLRSAVDAVDGSSTRHESAMVELRLMRLDSGMARLSA